jgi:hypothetical protein
MSPVLAATQIRESRSRARRQAERLVQLATGEQPGIQGDVAAVELELEATIELKVNTVFCRFTRWMRHAGTTELAVTYCSLIQLAPKHHLFGASLGIPGVKGTPDRVAEQFTSDLIVKCVPSP